MTLRVEVSIVPHGVEEGKYGLYRIDIHNRGLVRNEGFGHEICKYDYLVYRHNNETMVSQYGFEEFEVEATGVIPEHNRRDGALSLVQKVLDEIGAEV